MPCPLVMGIMKRTNVGSTDMTPVHAYARPDGDNEWKKSSIVFPLPQEIGARTHTHTAVDLINPWRKISGKLV